MFYIFEQGGFDLEKKNVAGLWELKMTFRE